MTEQCKGTLYVPQGARCVRRTTHPSGYCHDHRHQQTEASEPAKAVVATYTADIHLMTISQDGYRSLNILDALTIAQLAYEAGYRAAQRAAFGEASIQVLRDTGDYPHIPPSKFEGEYGVGAAAVMNWLNHAMDAPVPREES